MNINVTLVGQMVTFAIFVGFTMKFVWPAIMEALDERERTIKSGLQAAEQGRLSLESAEEESKQHIAKAKEQAQNLIAEAQDRGKRIEEQAIVEGNAKREQIVAQAMQEVNQQKQKLIEQLLEQVGEFVVAGASKVMAQEVDKKHHTELLSQVSEHASQAFHGSEEKA